MKYSRRIWGLLMFFPLMASIVILFYTPNIPVYDDYVFSLQSCIEFAQAPRLLDRLALVFSSLSSYMFVPFKAILLLDYSVFGKTSIVHLIAIAHIFNGGIMVILFLLFRTMGGKVISFVPVIILFGIPHFMALSWATYAAHTIGLFFTILVPYFMVRNDGRDFLLGFIAATLAAFSAPGGILALIVPLPILWYAQSGKRLFAWLGGCVLIAILYYQLNGGLGYDVEAAGQSVHWYEYVLNWLLFYGSFGKGVYRGFHAGSGIFALLYLMLMSFLLFNYWSKLKVKPVLLSMLLLSFLLGFAIMAMRSRLGLGGTTAYRYRLYQAVSWMLMYLVLFVVDPEFIKSKVRTFVAISVFSLFSACYNIKLLRDRGEELESSMDHYITTGQTDQLFTTDTMLADRVLQEAAVLGVYP